MRNRLEKSICVCLDLQSVSSFLILVDIPQLETKRVQSVRQLFSTEGGFLLEKAYFQTPRDGPSKYHHPNLAVLSGLLFILWEKSWKCWHAEVFLVHFV